MESAAFNTNRLLWIVAATGLCAGLVAFNQKQQKPKVKAIPQVKNLDTIPKKKERKIINLDQTLDEANRIKVEIDMEKLNIELAEISPMIEKEIADAKVEVDNALKEIDAVELKKEIETSLSNIDWKEINEQVNESVSKIDWDKIKKEIDEAKEINLDKINRDMKELNEQLKNIKPELQLNLKNVKIEMDKVKITLKEYKTFIDGLEYDGLINKQQGYTIQHKNGELIINGKTQPAGVYSKYRSFLEKHNTLNIEKSGNDFDIDHD
jgi:hypothetical protein